MNAQVPRQALQPRRDVHHALRHLRIDAPALSERSLPAHLWSLLQILSREPAFNGLRPRVGLAGVVPQRARRVPDGRAGPIRDHVGDLRGMTAPVALVHVLDHFLTPARFNIHVNIRRAGATRRKKAFEQHLVPHGVHSRDSQRETHGRIRCRASALAPDSLSLAKRHDVVDDEEISGESQLLDDLQLVIDLLPRLRMLRT